MALKMVDLPEHKTMVKNLLYTFQTASEEDLIEGMEWYDNAFSECDRIARKYDIDIERSVALVSVISPGLIWAGNVTAPEKIIDLWLREVPATEWVGFPCWKPNLIKAERILNGDMTAMVGPKVNAFYLNIMGDTDPITIDRWAIRACLDQPKLAKGKIEPSGMKVYNALSDTYRELAEIMGVSGPDAQAVCWTVLRNRWNGRVRKQKERERQTLEVVKP